MTVEERKEWIKNQIARLEKELEDEGREWAEKYKKGQLTAYKNVLGLME